MCFRLRLHIVISIYLSFMYTDTCRQIMQRPLCLEDGVHLHYVDCHIDVLQAASEDPHLQRWRLYNARWHVLEEASCLLPYFPLFSSESKRFCVCIQGLVASIIAIPRFDNAHVDTPVAVCVDPRWFIVNHASIHAYLHSVCRAQPASSNSKTAKEVLKLDLHHFHELMKWGMVMGVDDGCEPQPYEIQAMIEEDMRRT